MICDVTGRVPCMILAKVYVPFVWKRHSVTAWNITEFVAQITKGSSTFLFVIFRELQGPHVTGGGHAVDPASGTDCSMLRSFQGH